MLNKAILMGRLVRDPELRHTPSSIPVTSFTLAVDRNYGKGAEKQTDFIDCVAWRQTAEFVSKYFFKGSRIAVTGQIQIRSWDDAEGKKRFATEVIADDVEFVESKRQDSGYGNPAPLPDEPQTARANTAPSKAEKAPAASEGGDTYFALHDEDGCPF